MTERALVVQSCSGCGRPIDCCEFCDAADCGTPICHGCVRVVLGQAVPQPHPHGG
jgi:hypothetical protein